MDAWSPLQMAKMRLGGNTRLKTFFLEQEFPSNLPVKEKFDNDAMEKYRERLRAVAQGKSADKIEKIGYIPRKPRSPKRPLSSQVNSPGGFSRGGGSRRVRRPMSSMSGGSDCRKPAAKVWDLDSWMSNIQKKSSEVASTVAKGTADVTSKLQKGIEEVGQQLKEKDLGSKISSGWNVAVGWASKTVKNISEIIKEDDGKLYNQNVISASCKRKKMESKSSMDYFLGEQRGISSDSYFDTKGAPSSPKAKVTKTVVPADDREHSGLHYKGGSFTQHPETKLAAQMPIEQKVAAEKKKSKNKSAGFMLKSLDDTPSGVNDLIHKKEDNLSVSSGDETWEW